MPLGFYLFAGGFSLLCIERVLRSWGTYSSYAKEDESGDARGSALNAALLVTVVELGLAAGLCWFVATRAIAAGGSSKPAAATEQEPDAANGQDPGPGTAKTPDPNLWIPEREARELIGRDDEYFDLLVRWGDVRPKQLGGQKLYRRRDLTSIKEAGLPTVQYMKEGLANFEKIKGETQPPPEAPKPPVEKPGEELKE
ncbi:MAG: hypothetical protein M5U26_06220 [Planctomycetota bacterium]|nr:hypothetical protein [Planctomycetota bacterium]